jgi:hypothetical protein
MYHLGTEGVGLRVCGQPQDAGAFSSPLILKKQLYGESCQKADIERLGDTVFYGRQAMMMNLDYEIFPTL